MAANEHQQQKEEEDRHEPAHHARRPMNAFLIFCKRHRAAVRSGFPHLENRAVTRVLGEWWAMLSDEQKKAYTDLAQEYKDAFLNANPDFKWYKLPAPPLRTLNTRPTNKKLDGGFETTMTATETTTTTTTTSTKGDHQLDEDSIQPGKLADESQLGGLSSLFTPQKASVAQSPLFHLEDVDDPEVPKPPKKRCAELRAVSVESKDDCKANLFGDKTSKTGTSNDNSSSSSRSSSNKDLTRESDDCDAAQTYIEDGSFRGGRTCKGLRYQKFLAEQLNSQTKQRRVTGYPKLGSFSLDQSSGSQGRERRNSISSNVSEKTDSLSSEGTSSRGDLEHLVESAEGNVEASKPEDTETEGAEGHAELMAWTSRKRFKAEDFNLEKKIDALPSLSLDEFQAMKKQQRTKKKKITQKVGGTSKRPHHRRDSSSDENDRKRGTQKEVDASTLVGSQKRKARKNSITRNTVTTGDAPANAEQGPKAWCASPGLEALACLAAVAANRTKLAKS